MIKSVTADGVKTYRQLLFELYDPTILTQYRATSVHIGSRTYHNIDYDSTHGFRYSGSIVYDSGYELQTIQISDAQNVCAFFTYNANGFHTFSNTAPANGLVFSIWVNA